MSSLLKAKKDITVEESFGSMKELLELLHEAEYKISQAHHDIENELEGLLENVVDEAREANGEKAADEVNEFLHEKVYSVLWELNVDEPHEAVWEAINGLEKELKK